MKNTTLITETSFRNFSKKRSDKIRAGFKVVEYNDKLPYVVLSKESRHLNHSLHFQLFWITVGIWSIVWIYLTLSHTSKKEILIAIDEDGNVFEEKCVLS